METTEQWLSTEDIAQRLGISKESIYSWLDRNKIHAHCVGQQCKFSAIKIDVRLLKGLAADHGTMEPYNQELASN